MRTISATQKSQIDDWTLESGPVSLTGDVLEKDLHVTDALRALFDHPFSHNAELIFCGGTSLTKAYQWMGRMSEDMDFKILLPSEATKSTRRAVRAEIVERLQHLGFTTDEARWKRFNGSRQVGMEWHYQTLYLRGQALRPHMQIDLRFTRLRLAPTTQHVRSLIGASLPNPAPGFPVLCQNPAETLAEKLIAYLRRTLRIQRGGAPDQEGEPDNRSLIRHLHDTHAIVSHAPQAIDEAAAIFPDVLAEEISTGNRAEDFAHHPSPKAALEFALQSIVIDDGLCEQYDINIRPLLFEATPATFPDILAAFRQAAGRCIQALPE